MLVEQGSRACGWVVAEAHTEAMNEAMNDAMNDAMNEGVAAVARPDEAVIEGERVERFRVLPSRVRPEDAIGSVEARRHEGRPTAAPSEAQYTAIYHG